MISVPNHLLPLSGNNLVIWLLIVFFMQSCSVSKPVSATKDAQIVKAGTTPPVKDKSEPKTDQVENHKKDDKAGTVKPSIEKNIKVTLPVDTIRWDDVSDKNPPVKVRQKQKVIFAEGLDLKDEYNIKLLIIKQKQC